MERPIPASDDQVGRLITKWFGLAKSAKPNPFDAGIVYDFYDGVLSGLFSVRTNWFCAICIWNDSQIRNRVYAISQVTDHLATTIFEEATRSLEGSWLVVGPATDPRVTSAAERAIERSVPEALVLADELKEPLKGYLIENADDVAARLVSETEADIFEIQRIFKH